MARASRSAGVALAALAALAAGCADAPRKATTALTTITRPAVLGFNLATPQLVQSAASNGVTVAVIYGPAPTPDTPIGKALVAHHVKLITAEIADHVARYECSRTHTVAPPPSGAKNYCAVDTHYSVDTLLHDVEKIASKDKHNSLIVGHWILDDVAGWDAGGLRDLLTRIHPLLPVYQPALCGFSASLGGGSQPHWDPRRAANYTPTGCDIVAPYIYSTPVPVGGASFPVDWSMQTILPQVLRSLRDNGWDPQRVPFIGVGQAWAGQHLTDNAIALQPTPQEMFAQAGAYTRAGASGIGWYAWVLSNYPRARTPATDRQLADGVRRSTVLVPSR